MKEKTCKTEEVPWHLCILALCRLLWVKVHSLCSGENHLLIIYFETCPSFQRLIIGFTLWLTLLYWLFVVSFLSAWFLILALFPLFALLYGLCVGSIHSSSQILTLYNSSHYSGQKSSSKPGCSLNWTARLFLRVEYMLSHPLKRGLYTNHFILCDYNQDFQIYLNKIYMEINIDYIVKWGR